MMYETLVPAAELRREVLRECEVSPALGAFATADCVSYLFLESGGVRALSACLYGDDEIFSCAPEWPLFAWDEAEMRDEQGIPLAGYPETSPEVRGRGLTTIVVGPVHAGIIEPGRFTFSSGGENVVHLDARLGFSRRNVEARLEGRDVSAAAPLIARICGACSAARSWTYARAVETLAGIACSEPVELARIILAELERVYNHLFDLASACSGAGFGRGQMEGLRLKERVQRLCNTVAGHRFLFDAILPGGIRAGVLEERTNLKREIRDLRDDVARYGTSLFATDSLVRRFEGAGHISAGVARAFGAVGPASRASGGTLDVRTAAPYGAYALLKPSVVAAHGGDANARVRVKYNEALESLRLISLALEALRGHRIAPAAGIPTFSGRTAAVSEGPRGAEVVYVEIIEGRLARLHMTSASFRNWPVVVRAMEGNIIPDFPLVNKSFNLCYACADR